MKPICFFDSPRLLDCTVTPIPAFDQPPLEVVAYIPATVTRVHIIDGIGQFLEILVGPLGQEVPFHGLGNRNEIVWSCRIEKGARISLRSLSTAITSGTLACEFY